MTTLIQAQAKLIARANGCHPGHRRRVIRSAASELRRYLARIGTPAEQQQRIVRDAIDMANLEFNAED